MRLASGDEGLRPGGLLALVASYPAAIRDGPVLSVAPFDLSVGGGRMGQRGPRDGHGEGYSLDRGHAGTGGVNHGGADELDLSGPVGASPCGSDTDSSGSRSEGAERVKTRAARTGTLHRRVGWEEGRAPSLVGDSRLLSYKSIVPKMQRGSCGGVPREGSVVGAVGRSLGEVVMPRLGRAADLMMTGGKALLGLIASVASVVGVSPDSGAALAASSSPAAARSDRGAEESWPSSRTCGAVEAAKQGYISEEEGDEVARREGEGATAMVTQVDLLADPVPLERLATQSWRARLGHTLFGLSPEPRTGRPATYAGEDPEPWDVGGPASYNQVGECVAGRTEPGPGVRALPGDERVDGRATGCGGAAGYDGAVGDEGSCSNGAEQRGAERSGAGGATAAGHGMCQECDEPSQGAAETAAVGLLTAVRHRQRARRFGSVESHVRFCQHMWRRHRAARCTFVWRPVVRFRCRGGRSQAPESSFTAQKHLASSVLDWYAQYVYMLRRLRSNQPVTVIHGCAGGGGAVEGSRRMGGSAFCIDTVDMPSCRRRFGSENFVQADALSRAVLLKASRERRPIGAMYSPPCKPYSTTDLVKRSVEVPLIEQTRDVLRESGLLYSLENVPGAVRHMSEDATMLRGAWFGLGVDRPRYFETNFPLHVDEALRRPGEVLRAGTCLGRRRRFKRMDPFGRPVQTDCCAGNLHASSMLHAVQGERPLYSTAAECAAAMGIDEGHMPYAELAQAIPPDYASLVFAQMCMHQAAVEYGAPVITYDQLVARPAWARQQLGLWLRGGGAPEADIGASLSASKAMPVVARVDRAEGPTGPVAARVAETRVAEAYLSEVEFRELYHTHAGGFDRVAQRPGEPDWMSVLSPGGELGGAGSVSVEALQGHNSLLLPRSPKELHFAVRRADEALAGKAAGTRVTLVARETAHRWLSAHGFVRLREVVTSEGARVAFCRGVRGWCADESSLDYELLRKHMDPRDTGEVPIDKAAKQELIWSEIPWDPERWRGKGMPREVELLMTEGARVPAPGGAPRLAEFAQYPWDAPEAREAGISEADRAIIVGAMEYVPEDQLDSVLADGFIHPWTMALKGDKWRAYLYTVITVL